jgi:hypothetical protein
MRYVVNVTARVELLNRVGRLAQLDKGGALNAWVMGQADDLAVLLERNDVASATALFDLAEWTLSNQLDGGDHHVVARLTLAGVREMEDPSDVDAYESLPDALLTPEVVREAHESIERVLDMELDGIRQQDDPQVVESWIDEVRDRADRYSIHAYLDSAYEYLEELRMRPRQPRTRVSSIVAEPAPTPGDAGDGEIVDLFRRLAAEEFDADGTDDDY